MYVKKGAHHGLCWLEIVPSMMIRDGPSNLRTHLYPHTKEHDASPILPFFILFNHGYCFRVHNHTVYITLPCHPRILLLNIPTDYCGPKCGVLTWGVHETGKFSHT